jgi:PAS domain S-box-containing protein
MKRDLPAGAGPKKSQPQSQLQSKRQPQLPPQPQASTRYHRLRRNLVLSFSLFGLVLTAIIAWSVVNDYQRHVHDAELATQVLVRALDGHVDAVLSGTAVTLRDLAKRINDSGGARAMNHQQLYQLLKAQSEFIGNRPVIFVLGDDGELLANSADPELRLPRQPQGECLNRLRQKPDTPLCIARPIKSPVSGKWRSIVAVPLIGRNGQYEGVVGLGMDPEFFHGFYKSLGLGEDYTLLLARNDGIVLSRQPWVDQSPGRDISRGPLFRDGMAPGKTGTVRINSVFDGQDRLVSFHSHERLPLMVSAGVDMAAVLAPWQVDSAARLAFLLLAALGIAALLWVSLRQVRRLEASELDLLLNKFSIDRSAEFVLWIELDGRFRYANEAACLRCGYSREELLQLTLFDLCPGIDRGRWRPAVEVLRRKGSRRLMESFRTRSGETFQLDVVADLVEYRGDALICANARDVSAQRAAEAALRESETRYRSTVDSLHEGVLVRDHQRILACNPSAERIFGLPAARIVGRPALTPMVQFFDEQGRPLAVGEGPAFIALRSGKPQQGITYRLQRGDGSSLWLQANATPLFRTGETRPYRVVTTYADITQRREAEVGLRASEQKFAKVFDLIPEVVTVTDFDTGRYVDMNQAWEPSIGFSRAEAIGRTSIELGIWLDAEDRHRILQGVLADGAVRDREVRVRRKDGSVFLSRISGCAFEVQGQKLLMLITRDVTQQAQAEAARGLAEDKVRRLNEELEQRVAERTRELRFANREMEAFSYSVSHDLRAPLRAVEGFSALLEQTQQGEAAGQARDYLKRIRAAALRMGRLIDDMLNLSRLGRQQLEFETFDLAPLAQEIFDEVRAADPARNVAFATAGDMRVRGDLSLMRIALTNLIANAWKFTAPVAEARIRLYGERDRESVRVAIEDNGVGFDPAYSARLFGAFQRLHNDREFAGSGIGLAIVQRIVQRHGGDISASSMLGRGATFVVSLPLVPRSGSRMALLPAPAPVAKSD